MGVGEKETVSGMRQQTRVLRMPVDVTSCSDAVNRIASWIGPGASHYVCVSNVHMCMEVWDDREYEGVLIAADLVVPDGRPIYWAQKLLGVNSAVQVRGSELASAIFSYANRQCIPVGFYGGTQETLDRLKIVVRDKYPNMPAPLFISPPFRVLTPDEKEADIVAINNSSVEILFVGLGCPKQERWMAELQPHLSCTLLGVGAAFDFIAGTQKHAPKIFQVLGLEWLFRLFCEPRRLWRRYLSTNPRFIWYFSGQLMGRNY